MRIAIYPGTFDPITLGHMDVLTRAAKMFDKVYIVIMHNTKKSSLFSEEERLEMINRSIQEAGLENVEAEIGHGLTVLYAKEKGASVIVRGLRVSMDFEYEIQLASANMFMDDDIETIFLPTKPELSFISSTTVKEIAMAHVALTDLVPTPVEEMLVKKFQK
ncbi:MAG: pantetheine-phosphate adenylyltransferase [Erysipelotrichaceae bacterium]|nr:pantetheine-phosphate adenylyltransferase [Erysipelotrichaceae bacterium]MBR3694601.1 pantetheine-phosphate adenylyltransferase [Erysipelotrichales bacterium]